MQYWSLGCLAVLLFFLPLAKIKAVDELYLSFQKSEKELQLGFFLKESAQQFMLDFRHNRLNGYYRYSDQKLRLSVGSLSFNNYLTSLSAVAQPWSLATVNRQRSAWHYRPLKSGAVETLALRFFPDPSFPLGISIAFFKQQELAQGWISQLHLLSAASPLQLDALVAHSFTDGEAKSETKKWLRSANWQPLGNRYYTALSLYFKDEKWRARSQWSFYNHEYGFSALAVRNHLFTEVIQRQQHKLEAAWIINFYEPHYRNWQGKKPRYSQQYAAAFWYRWNSSLYLSYKVRLLAEKQEHRFSTRFKLSTWSVSHDQYLYAGKRVDWGQKLNFSFLQPVWRFSSALELHFKAEQLKRMVPRLAFSWKMAEQNFTLQSRLSLQLFKNTSSFRHTLRWRSQLGPFEQSFSFSLRNWPSLVPEKELKMSFRWRFGLRLKNLSFVNEQTFFDKQEIADDREVDEEQEVLEQEEAEEQEEDFEDDEQTSF